MATARQAFDEGQWPRMSPYERGRVVQRIADRIRERAEEIAHLESLNTGKPIQVARGEINNSAIVFDFYAGAGDKFYGESIPTQERMLDFTLREPSAVEGGPAFSYSGRGWLQASSQDPQREELVLVGRGEGDLAIGLAGRRE